MNTPLGKPNILFIMTDQQRADTIGPGRHPMADYPCMERLAGESVRFSHFYCRYALRPFADELSQWSTCLEYPSLRKQSVHDRRRINLDEYAARQRIPMCLGRQDA